MLRTTKRNETGWKHVNWGNWQVT